MFLHSLTHYFLYSSVRSRSAKTSIDIKTSQCRGGIYKTITDRFIEVTAPAQKRRRIATK